MIRIATFLSALFLVLLAAAPSKAVCGAAGAFVQAPDVCCAGLVADQNNRCQVPTCKKVDQAAVIGSNGTSDCCFGLVAISGKCKVPTLIANCTFQGKVPTTAKPCCKGLAKSTTGKCERNAVAQCSSTQVATCCYGPSGGSCNCFCPTAYYKE